MSDTKDCIWCGEEIKAKAKLCRYCSKEQIEQMVEKTLYEGSPRLLASLSTFLVDILLCTIVVGFFMLLYHYFLFKSIRYTVTTKKIVRESGIISKSIDNLDLFRVKDHGYKRSFGDFFIGTGTIYLVSSDATDPVIYLPGIPNARAVYDELVKSIAAARKEAGVTIREFE